MQRNGKKIEKIVVLGLGESGKAAVELADKKGFSAIGIDESSKCDIQKIASRLSDYSEIITDFSDDILPICDLIVISPGISSISKLGKLATENSVPVISELDFSSRFAQVPIVAITGTNGKTTVTEMTQMLLKDSIACGNIGYPLSRAVLDTSYRFLVVEASSFQLERVPCFEPEVAALLNVSPDHMDRYMSFQDYLKSKFNIFSNLPNPSNVIINYQLIDEWEKRKFNFKSIESSERPLTFSAKSPDADIIFKHGKVSSQKMGIENVELEKTNIKGLHNIENFMASLALASRLLSKKELELSVVKMLEQFKILPHRQEIIAESRGVKIVNDSKATNPDAVKAAIEFFAEGRNICLIAGGLDKQMDFSSILKLHGNIKKAFLVGECRRNLYKVWHKDIDCLLCNSFEDAVTKSVESASGGDVVLLSPGCASMDMFANYKERGEFFRKIILQSLT